jgi:ATP-binding cassette, subfamily B, bacterial PglK
MNEIQLLSHDKTVIIITHRFSTVKECDAIHMIRKDGIIENVPYSQLIENSNKFKMASSVSCKSIL